MDKKVEDRGKGEDVQPALLSLPERTTAEANAGEKEPEGEEAAGVVRLRRPQRTQMMLRAQCVDDLVEGDHPVRMVATVVEQLGVEEFCEPIKARAGVVGRDATDPRLLISLWL